MRKDDEQRARLARLAAMADEAVDTDDIPELPPERWAQAKRGPLAQGDLAAFYRPVKQPVTLRLDADVLAWFKAHAGGRGYQTEINRVLRQHVMAAERHRE
jgi:uncharacterized protein (DUF4415 family)